MKRLWISGLAICTLVGCTLEDLIRPDPSKSASPVTSSSSSQRFAEQDALAYIGTHSVAVVKELSIVFPLAPTISTQLQRLHNDLFFNVKNSGLSGWTFSNGVYTLVTQRDTLITMQFTTNSGTAISWDVLNPANYPLMAKTYPAEINGYQLKLEKSNFLNDVGVSLKADINAKLPTQIPLQGEFITTFTGSGSITNHPTLTSQVFRVGGDTNLTGSVVNGQYSFEANFDHKSYSGFGPFNQTGLSQSTPIQQNGVTVGEIRPNGIRWDIIINNQVIATSG